MNWGVSRGAICIFSFNIMPGKHEGGMKKLPNKDGGLDVDQKHQQQTRSPLHNADPVLLPACSACRSRDLKNEALIE